MMARHHARLPALFADLTELGALRLALYFRHDFRWHALGPDHAATFIADERKYCVPRHIAGERRAAKRQRSIDPLFIHPQIGDGDGHVQTYLEHQLSLVPEPRRYNNVCDTGIKVNEERPLTEQLIGDIALVRQRSV